MDLDTIPADLVGSVAINKTLSANQDGDSIGGSVDLRIKQATSNTPTLSITGTGGKTPIDNNRQVFSVASSTGVRFGPRNDAGVKKLGLELGYSYDNNARGIDDVEPVPDLDSSGNRTFDNLYLQQYLYDRTRYGFAGSVDDNLSPGTDLYAHGLFSNFRDYGQKYAYQLKVGSKVARITPLGATHIFAPISGTRSRSLTRALAVPPATRGPPSATPPPMTARTPRPALPSSNVPTVARITSAPMPR